MPYGAGKGGKMRRTQYQRFTVCWPSGDMETLRVPFLDARELAERLPHTEIFMEVKEGFTVYGRYGAIVGPVAVWWSRPEDQYVQVEKLPENDGESFHLIRSIGGYADNVVQA